MSKSHSRRTILAGLAAAPALAAPALALSGADAELLELGVQLQSVEVEFQTQLAIDRASPTFTVIQHDDGSFETDMEPWDGIHDRLFPLTEVILSKKAQTIPGLRIQARAVLLAARDLWEPAFMAEHDHERKFIESVCAFLEVPLPDVGAVS